MWYFRSPKIVFGDDALSELESIQGRRAMIVTDAIVLSLGLVNGITGRLGRAGLETRLFSEVEAEPSLETARRIAGAMAEFEPDWIVAVGGGSAMDASKGAWILYECPGVDLLGLSPLDTYGLRRKARLITIPTTSGSGSEASQACILRDAGTGRKVALASYELIPDMTIIDPAMPAGMPPRLTADTGIDALTHAVEVYNNVWSNDFIDGLCLQAVRLVFEYLPRAVSRGADDMEARAHMANAATLAGLGICNGTVSLAHALGHSAGSVFPLPHGRVTGLMLPLTIEYLNNANCGRYLGLTRVLGLTAGDECQASIALAGAIRELMREVGQPLSLREAGISSETFEANLEQLCDWAEMDLGYVMAPRIPDRAELKLLFEAAYEGRPVDF